MKEAVLVDLATNGFLQLVITLTHLITPTLMAISVLCDSSHREQGCLLIYLGCSIADACAVAGAGAGTPNVVATAARSDTLDVGVDHAGLEALSEAGPTIGAGACIQICTQSSQTQ